MCIRDSLETPADVGDPRWQGTQWRKLFGTDGVSIDSCELDWRRVIEYTTSARAATTKRERVNPAQARKYQNDKVVRDSLSVMGPDAARAMTTVMDVNAPAMDNETAEMIIA